MTQEEVKMRAELYSALAEGKTIQVKNPNGTWEDVKIEGLNKIYDYNNYRIKPESKYRPFKTQEECWNEMLKHQPFGWVKDKYSFCSIEMIAANFSKECIKCYETWFTPERMFKDSTFLDGTPFGVKIEEDNQ